MATLTTASATPVVKFADTLDIATLLPTDIAKFADKDFAAFTTQQQSDLNAEQLKVLSSKQLAALPSTTLKLLAPEAISGVDPKLVGNVFDVKNLSAEQFGALTPEQVKNLPASQFASLTIEKADVLTADQALNLSAVQLSFMPAKAVSGLTASIIEVLPKSTIAGFTPKNIIGFTNDTISALTTEQANALTSQQIAALPAKLLVEIGDVNMAALSPTGMKGLNKTNISVVPLDIISSDQFAALNAKQIALLTPAQLSLLNPEFTPLLTSKSISVMSAQQLGALTTDVISTLDPLSIKGLNVKNIKGLTTDQVAVINPDQSANLSKIQLTAFSSDQVSALTADTGVAIKPMVLKGLPGSTIEKMNAAIFASLSEEQVAGLTSTHIASLTAAQVANLTGTHIEKIKPAILKSLSTGAIGSLSESALSALTTVQLTQFTTTSAGQLESFTPAQAKQLSSTVKDWLLAKKFAIIESAETNVTGTSGIETSGTVAGEAVAETITSGAGNDIISTGGTTGDKIDSGAGDDTVTMTAASAGHRHTIAGAEGTDTLIFDGASNFVAGDLTNLSGFEKFKLTGTTDQTLNVGTGSNNALTNLDLDALADAKTLALTGSIDNLAVSLTTGDLDASAYTGDLVVTATGGSNILKTGTGADSINAGAGIDEITAGAGVDTMTGGSDADTFKFTAGSSGGAPSATVFDTVTDFVSNTDVIDFTDVSLTIAATSADAATGTAKILPTGKATFVEADDTLAERITATESALSPTAGRSALFTYGSDSYVFVSDANDGVTTNDTLIKLSGVTGTSLGISGGNISKVNSYTVATFNGGAGLSASDTVYIVDTAAAINAAVGTVGTGLVAQIANIDAIIASDNNAITLTPAQFATVGVPAVFADGSVTVTATGGATEDQKLALINNLAKLQDAGITGTLVLTPEQFATTGVVGKLANATATVVADGTNVATLVANAAKIQAAGLTGTVALTATQFATSGVTTALNNGATIALTLNAGENGNTTGFIDALVASYAKIANDGVTLNGGSLSLTPTQLNTVTTKLADGVASVAVTNPSSTEVGYLASNAPQIATDGITGSGLSLDETQFNTLSAKIAAAATNVTVDATGVTAGSADLAAIVSGIGKIDVLTTSGTIPFSAAQFATAGVTTALATGKAAISLTTASNGNESGFVTALLATPTDISTGGVTLGAGGVLTLSATEFATAGVVTTLGASVASVTFASGTPSDVAAVSTLVANPTKIANNGITGTGLSVDEVQFSALSSKLSTTITDVTVDASSATIGDGGVSNTTSGDVGKLISNIDRVGTINVSGTLSVTDTQFKALQGKLNSGISGKITVDATNATVDELAAMTVSANLSKIVAVTNLSLDVSQSAANITSLLGKTAVGSVTVNPTNFDADQIAAIVTGETKIATGGITGAEITIPLTATQFNTLVNKISAVDTDVDGTRDITAIVDATGANAAQIATMTTAANAAKISTVKGTGITLTAAQFNTLDSLLDSGVTVTVNASGASFTDLKNISDNITKVASITGLSLALGTDVHSGGTETQNNTITANLLSKATGATVNAAGATTAELSSLFTHIANVSSLSNSDFVVSASQFVTLQSTLPTGTVIDATGATASQLSLIAADIASGASTTKVGSITNLTLSLGAQSSTEASNLLSKAANNSVTTNITGANNINGTDYTPTLVSNAGKFATGGLTGSNLSLTDTQFAALATKFASSVTDVIVDAGSGDGAAATAAELAAISANIARVGLVKNVALVAATQTDTEVENLLSKSFNLDATINANGASTAQMNSVVSHINKITTGGVTGASATLTVTPTQFSAITGKLTGSATVDATGANATQLTLLSGDAKAPALTNLTLSVSQSDTEMTALLGKVGAGTAYASLISPSALQIAALATAHAKLVNGGLSGSGYAMTDTEFSTLASKFGAGVTTAVNATNATDTELTAISNGIAHVSSISNLTLTTAGSTVTLGAGAMTDTVTANLLSKAVNGTATVEATGASDAEIASLTTYANKLATAGVTGTLTLTDTQFATLHPKLATTATVTVNAAGATTGELTVLSTNNTKVDTIKNLVVTAANQTDAETLTLLGLAEYTDSDVSGTVTAGDIGKAKVIATGATATEVGHFVTKLLQIDPNGITGTLAITDAVSAANIPTLFAKYADGVATVNATNMEASSAAQLIAVAAVTGKIATGGISNMTLVANDLTDTQTSNLLSKATGATVTATSASTAEVASFAQYIGNITAIDATGTLPITAGASATDITALFGKYAGTTAIVNALGMNSNQIANVVTNAGKIGAGTLTNASLDEVQFATDVAGTKTVIAALAAGAATVDATGASAANQAILLTDANLAKIAGSGLSNLSVDLSDAGVTTAIGSVTMATLTAKVTGTLTIAGAATADTVVLTNYTGATSTTGGNGADAITNGGGADTFIYTAVSATQSGSVLGVAGGAALPVATTVDTIVSFATGVDKIALPVALGAAAASGTLVPTNGTPYTTSSVLLEADDFVTVTKIAETAAGTNLAANASGQARFYFDVFTKTLFFDANGDSTSTGTGAAVTYTGMADDFAVVTTTAVTLVSTDFIFV